MARDLNLTVHLAAIDKATAPIRSIMQGSGKLAKQLQATRDQLKALNSQQKDVSSWRALSDASKQTADNLAASNKTIADLGHKTAATRQQLAPLKTMLEEATRRMDGFSEKSSEAKGALSATRNQLGLLGDQWTAARGPIAAYNDAIAKGTVLSQKDRAEMQRLIAEQVKRKESLDQLKKREKALAEQYTVSNRAVRNARSTMSALRQEVTKIERPHKELLRQFEQARGESKRLGEQYGQQQRELGELGSRLNTAGIKTNRLGVEELRLKKKLEATNGVIRQQEDRLKRLGEQQKRLAKAKKGYEQTQALAGSMAGSGAGAIGAGAAMGAPVLGVVKSYMGFEDAMLGVAKQVEGARDGNGKLTQTYFDIASAIKRMAEEVPMATTELAALVEGGARMGIQGKANLLEFARVAANAATAFELPADELGENLARIANLYKLPIKNVSQLGDAINYLDDNAQSKGADIIDVLQRTAGITASVGMSFKDAAALGSTFLTLGASAEVAATATSAMIRELAIATQQPKRFQEGLKAIGIEAGTLQAGMAKDATGTLQTVLKAIKQLPQDQQLSITTQLFGKEFGDDAAKLAANIGEYQRQLELANSSGGDGSMQREAEIRADALSARLAMSQNRMFNLASSLGATLRPALVELIEGFNRVLSRVTAWAEANPTLVFSVLKLAGGLSALAVGFGTITLGMASLLGPFALFRYGLSLLGIKSLGLVSGLVRLGKFALPLVSKGILLISGAVRGISIALWGLAANPVFLVIAAAVAVLAGAAYLIWRNWDTLGPKFAAMWEGIKAIFVLGTSQIVGFFTNALGQLAAMPEKFAELGVQLMHGLARGITNALGAVKSAVTGAGDQAIGWFKDKLGIHSPSRVFAELGGFTMAGLTQGLAGGEDGPLSQLGGFAKRMTQAGALALGVGGAAMPALAGGEPLSFDNRPPLSASAGAGVSIGGDTYHITIQAAPGGNASDLAQQISRMLDERERSKAARIRSRLHDQD